MKKVLLMIITLAISAAGSVFASGTAFDELRSGSDLPEVKIASPFAPVLEIKLDGSATDHIYQGGTVDSREKADADLQSYLMNMKAGGAEIVSSFVDSIEDGQSTLYRFVITYRGKEVGTFLFDGSPAKDKADIARDQALAGFQKAGIPVVKYGIRFASGAFSFYAVYMMPENDPRKEMSYMSLPPEATSPLNMDMNATVRLLEANGMPVLYSLASDAKTRFMIRFIGKGEIKRVQGGGYGSYPEVLQGIQQKLGELSQIPGSMPLDFKVYMSSLSYAIDYLQP